MKKFKAAIFDMDGTLLESMYIWRNLAPEYLKRNNIAVPDDLLERIMRLRCSWININPFLSRGKPLFVFR